MSNSSDEKRKAFVREYIVDFNATQAAIRAGYAKKSAATSASRLLRNDKIQAEIAKQVEKRAKRTEITADRVLTELWEMHSFDIREAFNADGTLKPVDQIPDGMAKMISGIEVSEIWEGFGDAREQVGVIKKLKIADRLKAIELVGKHVNVAAFRERVALSDPNDGPLFDPDSLSDDAKRELIKARRAASGGSTTA